MFSIHRKLPKDSLAHQLLDDVDRKQFTKGFAFALDPLKL